MTRPPKTPQIQQEWADRHGRSKTLRTRSLAASPPKVGTQHRQAQIRVLWPTGLLRWLSLRRRRAASAMVHASTVMTAIAVQVTMETEQETTEAEHQEALRLSWFENDQPQMILQRHPAILTMTLTKTKSTER